MNNILLCYKYALTIFILINSVLYCFCQSTDLNCDVVESLNWKSIEIIHSTYGSKISFTDSATSEVLRVGKDYQKCLIGILMDNDRGVVAHLLLTTIFDKKEFVLSVVYIYNNDDIIQFSYSLNQLTWVFDFSSNSFVVSDMELYKIKEYWMKNIGKRSQRSRN
jgi:hypothetical protein